MPARLARTSRVIWFRERTGGRLALATLFLLLGCTSLKNAVAEDDTRTLSFQHTHRDDAITVTFKRNGRYDEEGLKKLNYFLRDWRTDEQTRMDPQLFDVLWEVYREVGAKEAIQIVSSYRSPATNAMLRRRSRGVAKFSQHMLGKAIDFHISGVPLEELRYAGWRLQRGGVGYYPGSFVHLDVGSVRHWPRMSHDQLARAFSNGKTRSAGIKTADASGSTGGRGRNMLAKMLGIGSDEEEEKETAAPSGGKPASARTPARQELAAAVPMPRSRPARAGAFTLASATSSPANLSAPSRPAPPTPADVISSRGYWESASDTPALQPEREPAAPAPAAVRPVEADSASVLREALSRSGERLARMNGSEGQFDPPRPPRDIEGAPPANAVPSADTTASLASWASNPVQNDRAPAEMVLAYAAPKAPEPVARPAPMGTARPTNVATAGNATVATKVPPAGARSGQRGNDPWLRGVVMTPSVHHSLSVAVVGATDYRSLRPLMQKPKTTLAMVFSNDPTLGITSLHFSGPAVSFLPTISFGPTRTAGLH